MSHEPFAEELAQRLTLLIGMIMEDEIDQAITVKPSGPKRFSIRTAALGRSGEDITKLAAAEVVLKRYGGASEKIG